MFSMASPETAFHGTKWGHSELRSEENKHFGTCKHCLEEEKHRNIQEGWEAAGAKRGLGLDGVRKQWGPMSLLWGGMKQNKKVFSKTSFCEDF